MDVVWEGPILKGSKLWFLQGSIIAPSPFGKVPRLERGMGRKRESGREIGFSLQLQSAVEFWLFR